MDLSHFIAVVYPLILVWVKHIVVILIGISLPLSVFFLIGIIYCVEQLKVIRERERVMYDVKLEEAYEPATQGNEALAKRWQSVLAHIESSNQNDWRQAIMEADIILDELLTKMEYRGESIGEKLKRATHGDFHTIDQAWEAHKIRNQLAHEGSEVSLTQFEARRVVNLYKKVFEEFYYI